MAAAAEPVAMAMAAPSTSRMPRATPKRSGSGSTPTGASSVCTARCPEMIRRMCNRALDGAVGAVRNFDGVHRGHRAVIAAARKRAQVLARPAAALTFEPHPRSFFHPGETLFRLSDERAKLRLLAATDLKGAIVL